jgi:hypothetical protein
MKAWALMLAIVPLLPTESVSPRQPASCAVAIAIDVRAPLVWGETEWHLFTREVEQTWAAYGVTFCWAYGPALAKAMAGKPAAEASAGKPNMCEGLEVRIRVVVAADLPTLDTATGNPSLGRIHFRDGDPLAEIELSLAGASRLTAHARFGDRPVASWPGAIGARLLPRVLGRGLAHEIGHFVLRSREHTASGLMAAGFTPDAAAWGDVSRFRLSKASALSVTHSCDARRMAAR